MVANQGLEVEIAMGILATRMVLGWYPVPISVSSGHFALRYEVPKFLARGGHLCMAMLTIAAAALQRSTLCVQLGPSAAAAATTAAAAAAAAVAASAARRRHEKKTSGFLKKTWKTTNYKKIECENGTRRGQFET